MTPEVAKTIEDIYPRIEQVRSPEVWLMGPTTKIVERWVDDYGVEQAVVLTSEDALSQKKIDLQKLQAIEDRKAEIARMKTYKKSRNPYVGIPIDGGPPFVGGFSDPYPGYAFTDDRPKRRPKPKPVAPVVFQTRALRRFDFEA